MAGEGLRIGLAAARNPAAMEERLQIVERFLEQASALGVAIVCFPEAYLPGLRGEDFPVPPPDQHRQQAALDQVCAIARRNKVAVIMGMEWQSAAGLLNVAFVVNRDGTVQGYQAKNQLAPQEDAFYVPDGRRQLFAVDGVPFGIAICHEGWRYPESVRWPAVRGARIVFHPQFTGSDRAGHTITRWGDPGAPYYEKAMIGRAVENAIYFASVNCALRYQDSATSLISPDGSCLAHVPYGQEQLLVYDVDLTQATGLYAQRFNAAFYDAGQPVS